MNSPNIWVLQGYSDPNDYFKGSITDTFTRREKTFAAGLRVYDISQPAEPREIAFMPVEGLWLHRLWYVGGRYAYASAHWEVYTGDHILAVIDMAQPTKPEIHRALVAAGHAMRPAERRRPGRRGGAMRCIMRSSPAIWPTAPGATVG